MAYTKTMQFKNLELYNFEKYCAMICWMCIGLTTLKLAMHWVILIIVDQFLSLSVVWPLLHVPF